MISLTLLLAAAVANPAPASTAVSVTFAVEDKIDDSTYMTPLTWDDSRFSKTVTECDTLAAHPADPNKVAPGVSESGVDLKRALIVCKAAVEADPKNIRLVYQYARVLGYSGQGELAFPYRKMAVDDNYPQALFVVGYIALFGIDKQPKDSCYAAHLIRKSARYGRLAGQAGYASYWLSGKFDGCPNPASVDEMIFQVGEVKKARKDYYSGILLDRLTYDLEKLR